MTDADGNYRQAEYDSVQFSAEPEFSLSLGAFEAGLDGENEWGLRDDLRLQEGLPFVTADQNPGHQCTSAYGLSGWLVTAMNIITLSKIPQ